MSTTSNDSGCPKTITVPLSVNALSGYTRISEFTFTPLVTSGISNLHHKDISSVKTVWDFGDGYTLSADTPYTPTHIYDYPGTYNVTAFFYDSQGNALLNAFGKTITVKNFITNRVDFEQDRSAPYFKAGVLAANNGNLKCYAQVTWQDYVSSGNTVYFAASGEGKADLYDENYKYAFLLPYRAFYNTDTERVTKLTKKLTPEYYILDSTGTPVSTAADASGAKLLGAKGEYDLFYFDDNQGSRRLFAALDTSNHTLPDYFINQVETDINLSDMNYMESNVAYIDVVSVSALSDKLVLTSTGNTKMSLPAKKKQGDKFQVFVAAGDNNNNIHKYYDKFYYSNTDFSAGSAGAFQVTVDGSTSSLVSSVSSDKYPYSTSLSSSYLSSFFYFNFTPTVTGDHTIRVEGRPSDPTHGESPLSGSYTFTVYPSAGDDVYKVNEVEFDYAETLKSYRFQDFLNDYDQLFDGVIGTIVGTASSTPTTYGKAIYERISNFVMNRSDVDTCNIAALKKFYELLNEEANFTVNTAPTELQRLIDLYSIRLRRLIGDEEKFNRSFNTFYSSNSAFAKNIDINNEIDVSTYTVSAGVDFVAVQKFNNENILIQPQKIAGAHTSPTSVSAVSSYPLSAYNVNSTWGWLLDTTVTGTELSQLYNFYPFIDYYTDTKKNSVIDYTVASHNTLSTTVSTSGQWDGDKIYTEINRKIRKGLNI